MVVRGNVVNAPGLGKVTILKLRPNAKTADLAYGRNDQFVMTHYPVGRLIRPESLSATRIAAAERGRSTRRHFTRTTPELPSVADHSVGLLAPPSIRVDNKNRLNVQSNTDILTRIAKDEQFRILQDILGRKHTYTTNVLSSTLNTAARLPLPPKHNTSINRTINRSRNRPSNSSNTRSSNSASSNRSNSRSNNGSNLKTRLKKIETNAILQNTFAINSDKVYQNAFGSDLCGFSRGYNIGNLRLRLAPIMPLAYIDEMVIEADGTSRASFLVYNALLDKLKRPDSRFEYLVMFVRDKCRKHMSVLFHFWPPDRLFYFNTGFDKEMGGFLRYITHREIVPLDYEWLQETLPKSQVEDKFCVLHSAAFAYALYKHFETARGNPINDRSNIELPFTVSHRNASTKSTKSLSIANNVHPIYREYVNTIFRDQETLPVLAEFLIKLKHFQRNNIRKYLNSDAATRIPAGSDKGYYYRSKPFSGFLLPNSNTQGQVFEPVVQNSITRFLRNSPSNSGDRNKGTVTINFDSFQIPIFDLNGRLHDNAFISEELNRRYAPNVRHSQNFAKYPASLARISSHLGQAMRPVLVHRECKGPGSGGGLPSPVRNPPRIVGRGTTNTNTATNTARNTSRFRQQRSTTTKARNIQPTAVPTTDVHHPTNRVIGRVATSHVTRTRQSNTAGMPNGNQQRT